MDAALWGVIGTVAAAIIAAAGLLAVAIVNRGGKAVEDALRERLAHAEARLTDCEEDYGRLEKAQADAQAELKVLRDLADRHFRGAP